MLVPTGGLWAAGKWHQPRSHCSGCEEWGPGTGADSVEWSNSGLRTSISPVCEDTGSSSWQQGLRQDERKPQQITPPIPPGTHWCQAWALIHSEVTIFILLIGGGRLQFLWRFLMPGGSKMAGSSVHSPRVRGPEEDAQCIVAVGRGWGEGRE